jgi:hypothetical protein
MIWGVRRRMVGPMGRVADIIGRVGAIGDDAGIYLIFSDVSLLLGAANC